MSTGIKWLDEVVKEVESDVNAVIEREVRRFTEKFGLPADRVEKVPLPDPPFAELYFRERVIVNNQHYDVVFRNFHPEDFRDLRDEDIPAIVKKYGEVGLKLARKITEKIGGRIVWYDDDGDVKLYIIVGADSIKLMVV